jgi:hypothetical protein
VADLKSCGKLESYVIRISLSVDTQMKSTAKNWNFAVFSNAKQSTHIKQIPIQ